MIKEISAEAFALMIKSGSHNLSNNKAKVDALNVFPVPDGDTGTNMSLTFKNAAKNIPYEASSADEVARAAAWEKVRRKNLKKSALKRCAICSIISRTGRRTDRR